MLSGIKIKKKDEISQEETDKIVKRQKISEALEDEQLKKEKIRNQKNLPQPPH